MSTSKKISFTSLLIAINLFLPGLIHFTGISGNVLLPMHIGVFLCGFLVDAKYALLCGIISPIMSSLITGMPPVIILPTMVIELACYGFITGVLYSKTNKVYLSLITAMIFGRLISYLGNYVLINLLMFDIKPATAIIASIIVGLPGIVIQLVLIPLVVKYLFVNLAKTKSF